jgi:hypothetical protein
VLGYGATVGLLHELDEPLLALVERVEPAQLLELLVVVARRALVDGGVHLSEVLGVVAAPAGRVTVYVQRQLGHASIQLTVDTYGRWLPVGNKAAVDRLDGLRPVAVPLARGGKTVAADVSRAGRRPQVVEKGWSQRSDLNRRPADYESAALPTELRWRVRSGACVRDPKA